MKRIKAGRVMARCIECGAEAVTRGDGIPPTMEHEADCPERMPREGEPRLVRSGVAQGARVIYRPRGDEDRSPWVVESKFHPYENGWRFGTQEVCTLIEYRNYAQAKS